MSKVVIDLWTDGGVRFSDKVGGCGIIVQVDKNTVYEESICFTATSSERCELLAVLLGLDIILSKLELYYTTIHIHTDCEYITKTMTKWINIYSFQPKRNLTKEGWVKEWKKVLDTLKPRKNYDLFKELCYVCTTNGNRIFFNKVKAHSGTELNESADGLVKEAHCKSFSGRRF